MTDTPIILASASKSRQMMLTNAGLDFTCQPADIDEDAIKQSFLGHSDDVEPGDLAMLLAMTKANAISESNRSSLVIGADQLLLFEGEVMSKAPNMEAARDHLLRFRGKAHVLEGAVCCVRNGETVWSYSDRATMHVRNFSPEFLGRYLAGAGEKVLASVGCYQLEGEGVQLFDKIEGDFFTILGLPMLPLLEFLRSDGVLDS